METPPHKKTARWQFFGLYLFSLILIFIVVSAFWKASEPVTAAPDPTKEDAAYFMQIDTLLHTRMAALDATVVHHLKNGQASDGNVVQAQFYQMQQAIDGVEKQASFLEEGSRKQVMQFAAASFREMLVLRKSLLSGTLEAAGNSAQPSATPGNPPSSTSADEVAKLRQLLAQKDERIMALEQRVNTSAAPGGGNDSELKQKYTSLKAAFEKTAASEKALKAAYNTVAEDNRRLLNQLQTIRSEKKN